MHMAPPPTAATAAAGNGQEAGGPSAARPGFRGRRRAVVGYFLAVVMTVALTPIAVLGGYAVLQAHRSQRAEAELRMMEVARAAATAIEAELQARVTPARLLAALPAFDTLPAAPPEALQRLFETMQHFSTALDGAHIAVWALDGPAPVQLAATDRPFERLPAPVAIPEGEAAVRRAAGEGQPVVSAAFQDPASGRPTTLLAVPVPRPDRAAAVITFGMPLAPIQQALEAQALPPEAFAVVVDAAGRVAARVPEQHIGREVREDYRRAVDGIPHGIFRGTSLDGVAVVAAHTDLRLAPGYKVSVAAPVAVVEAGWIATRDLMATGAICAAVVAIGSVLLSDRLWRSARGRLLDQDAYLTIALDKTGLATWESDRFTGRALWSPRHFDILGYPRDPRGEVPARMWWDAVHPDDLGAVREQWRVGEEHPEGLMRLTYRIIRRDNGEIRWCESIGRLVGPGRLIGVILDVTDARREEEERLLLAREVDHRAKNLLAVVQAMVAMTRAGDAAMLRSALSDRILSLAKTHTLLARNRWVGSDVREVAENELRARGEAVVLQGGHVPLRPDAVQPFAMALHELATNAAKYGALSTEGGQVRLAWRIEGAQLLVDWREAGGPEVEEPTSRGFGSRMIARVLAQVGGTVEFAWDRTGLAAHIAVPLDRVGS